jgi:hypothetical protein
MHAGNAVASVPLLQSASCSRAWYKKIKIRLFVSMLYTKNEKVFQILLLVKQLSAIHHMLYLLYTWKTTKHKENSI